MSQVCCLCERWESGGIESFLYNVITHMDLGRIHVDVVAASMGESVFTQPLEQRGVHFIPLSGSQRKIRANHRLFQALLRERRWDVLHVNAFHGLSLYYLRLAREAGIPVRIAHSHNTALRHSATRPLKLMLHHHASQTYTADATQLWACSRAAAQFLYPEDMLERIGVRIIPNGIHTAQFRFDASQRARTRAALGVEDAYVIGNVGRLCYQKNQTFLLDVLKDCLVCRPNTRLLLIGAGEEKEALQKKAEQMGLADKVIFYGLSEQVAPLLWAMDVFAFPSKFEGLGIAAIEAQAAGLPTLVSEHIPGEAKLTSLLYTMSLVSGSAAWAKRLLTFPLVKDRQRYAAQVRQAGFDVADVAKNVESCYQTLEIKEE